MTREKLYRPCETVALNQETHGVKEAPSNTFRLVVRLDDPGHCDHCASVVASYENWCQESNKSLYPL